jgi:hypothetical protein
VTATARHDDPCVTDSADVRARVRATETGSVVPIRPGRDPGFAYTHAIPRSLDTDKTNKPSKIRNFASQHAGEAAGSLKDGWLGSGQPKSLSEVASTVIPAKGETSNWAVWSGVVTARTFRLCVHTLAYLLCAATDTDERAAVAFVLTVLTFTTALTVTALTGH